MLTSSTEDASTGETGDAKALAARKPRVRTRSLRIAGSMANESVVGVGREKRKDCDQLDENRLFDLGSRVLVSG
jgi:hypothetical protein